MSALSEATAVRRSLAEAVNLTLGDYTDGILANTASDELRFLAEAITDSLIDAEWVVGAPFEIRSSDLFQRGWTEGQAEAAVIASQIPRTVTVTA